MENSQSIESHTNNIIKLKNVSCKAGMKYLLRDINWNVMKGEHWVVFGMNGSGKTTLLSIIAGFKHFSEGTVSILGQEYNNENILEIRKRIGWVSSSFFDKYYTQESALHIVLSGLNGTLGLDDKITLEDVKLAKELLIKLNLGDKINRTFDTFSKGERQNILIARALISRPEILILDEPCTGLDVYNRSLLFQTIEGLSEEKNLTIIYVTHYIEEIIPLFDNMLLLKNGHIFSKGKTEQLITKEIFDEFLGYPVDIYREKNGTYRLEVIAISTLMEIL